MMVSLLREPSSATKGAACTACATKLIIRKPFGPKSWHHREHFAVGAVKINEINDRPVEVTPSQRILPQNLYIGASL